ncbi:ABC transporter substrate-binding protein [Clostridium botulinum]|uniref:ABC transporter substrate-binding protein n=1 Tax=Clostridium botulinum C/D str. DC5 TaxID=1443128 RepID=A0A0A0ICK5_CLOBO|nr:ABC transporter substrate-binding protein [Clostridium botulinum]KEI00411.1 ABC transporter substrate-binding protein [Clostridium botulinum C/D str. BKT75002]KEI12669.1 ABC transporter substrate-binding protein [Clostridium botulinum C/D str. BKT2873]KGM95230.1 ABC transporter substrate-binding protein [Clostridium botulinum D str. CCUG 7971]KGM99179.1 ABC transporter substrate-binding protein [Clostridium botulinum C/D str. DC5]KOC46089.1 ABC transporter substrate-binding protein [Clostri
MFKRNSTRKSKVLSLFLALAMIFTCVFSFTGCVNKPVKENKTEVSESVNYPLKIKDSYNREVTIDKEPNRIVSIAPNITETVFALGKGDKLVGRTDYCNYPENTKKVTTIGSLTNPNIEKIVELKPDVVIASTHFKKDVLSKLEKLNIKVVVLYGAETFDGVYDTINKAGEVLNAKTEANKLVKSMKEKVTNVTNKIKKSNKPKVYYVVSYGKMGDFTATGDTFIGNMIEMAGGINVAKDSKKWKYSIEKLVEKNPDIIICSKYFDTKKGIEMSNGYKDLKAVKNRKLIEIDNNLLDRQGPRIADGLDALAKIIHPDLFK